MKLNLTISILILPYFFFSQTKQNNDIDSLLIVWEDTSYHDTLRADAFQSFIYKKYFRRNNNPSKIFFILLDFPDLLLCLDPWLRTSSFSLNKYP